MANLVFAEEEYQSALNTLISYLRDSGYEGSLEAGTGIYDAVLKPNALLYSLFCQLAEKVKPYSSLQQATDMHDAGDISDDEYDSAVDSILSNWFVSRNSGTYTTGTVRLWFTQAVDNLSFYNGQTIGVANSITLVVNGFQTFTEEDFTQYINSVDTYYEYYIDVEVRSDAYTDVLIDTSTSVTGTVDNIYYIRATIPAQFIQGRTVESSEDFIARTKKAITTRELITYNGIDTVLKDTFESAANLDNLYIAGYGTDEMIRDKATIDGTVYHYGNMADLWCATKMVEKTVSYDVEIPYNVSGTASPVTIPLAESHIGHIIDATTEDGTSLALFVDADEIKWERPGYLPTLTVSIPNSYATNVNVFTYAIVGSSVGRYGTIVMEKDGSYEYTVDTSNPVIRYLMEGESVTELYNYRRAGLKKDASTGLVTEVDETLELSIKIFGVSKGLEISAGEAYLGSVADHAATKRVYAVYTYAIFGSETGSYGTIAMQNTGSYSYIVDTSNASIANLATGATLTETFTYRVGGLYTGSNSYTDKTVSILITGAETGITLYDGVTSYFLEKSKYASYPAYVSSVVTEEKTFYPVEERSGFTGALQLTRIYMKYVDTISFEYGGETIPFFKDGDLTDTTYIDIEGQGRLQITSVNVLYGEVYWKFTPTNFSTYFAKFNFNQKVVVTYTDENIDTATDYISLHRQVTVFYKTIELPDTDANYISSIYLGDTECVRNGAVVGSGQESVPNGYICVSEFRKVITSGVVETLYDDSENITGYSTVYTTATYVSSASNTSITRTFSTVVTTEKPSDDDIAPKGTAQFTYKFVAEEFLDYRVIVSINKQYKVVYGTLDASGAANTYSGVLEEEGQYSLLTTQINVGIPNGYGSLVVNGTTTFYDEDGAKPNAQLTLDDGTLLTLADYSLTEGWFMFTHAYSGDIHSIDEYTASYDVTVTDRTGAEDTETITFVFDNGNVIQEEADAEGLSTQALPITGSVSLATESDSTTSTTSEETEESTQRTAPLYVTLLEDPTLQSIQNMVYDSEHRVACYDPQVRHKMPVLLNISLIAELYDTSAVQTDVNTIVYAIIDYVSGLAKNQDNYIESELVHAIHAADENVKRIQIPVSCTATIFEPYTSQSTSYSVNNAFSIDTLKETIVSTQTIDGVTSQYYPASDQITENTIQFYTSKTMCSIIINGTTYTVE